jgi:hypothetical protein
MIDEFLLQGMQFISLRQALDCLDGFALHLGSQYEAGADQHAIDSHGASTAIACRAAFLRACEFQLVT